MPNFQQLNTYEKITFVAQNIQLIVGIVGIASNSIAFAIFRRKSLRKHSFAFYFRLLCLTDNLVLVHTLRHWIRLVHNVNIDIFGPLICRFIDYQPYVVGSMSLWLRVLILVDRLIRVNYPKHFKIMRSKSFQLTAVFVILIFSSSLHLILPINTRLEIVEVSTNSSTKLICYLPPEILKRNLTLVLCNLGLSIVIAIFMDIKLISFIYSSRNKMNHRPYRPHKSVIKDRKFAISSIGVSFTFFFCILTFGFSTLVAANFNLNRDYFQAVFTSSLTFTLLSNSSVLFVNLFLNSIFYDEFRSFIGLKKLHINY